MPFWLWKLVMIKMVTNRPQASFLPFVQDSGTVKPADIESYRETLKIIKAKDAEKAGKA